MIQGFVNSIADGYLKDSIASDIESYGLAEYLIALRTYLEEHPNEKYSDAAVELDEGIYRAIEDLER